MRGNEIIEICGCGRPLYASLDKTGKRIGLCHSLEDEEHHYDYWSPERCYERWENEKLINTHPLYDKKDDGHPK